MNHANSTLAKTEIIKQLGYFPAFLIPAISSSLIYRSLVQQTLFAYINNPLPARFKEKLFILLSRYFGISYFTICHSCTLRSLGTSAAEIMQLGDLKYPQFQADVANDLHILNSQWQGEDATPPLPSEIPEPNSGIAGFSKQRRCDPPPVGACVPRQAWHTNLQLETSLLRCSALIFLHPEQTASLSDQLRDLLGTVNYHYLIVFLGYIKLCHQWLLSHPDISHQQDRRSQLHLGSLLLEETKLADFLTTSVLESNKSNNNFSSSSSQQTESDQATISPEFQVSQSIAKLRKKALTTCLANAPFPVMIHTQNGEIIYLNQNWLEATGYNALEIGTINQWNQKAQVKQREIVKLPAKDQEQLLSKYVASAHQTTIETTVALKQIIDSLIDIVPENIKARVNSENKVADAIRSEVTISTSSGEQLFWELYSAALNLDGGQEELTIAIARDITDTVHHEIKLAEVEAKLRLALEATNSGNWSWDLITNQVEVCHYGRSILGLNDFDGSYGGFLQSIHPDERESIDLAAAKAIQAGQDLDLKYSIVKSNQEISQIRAKGILNYDQSGQPISLTGVVTDITATTCNQQPLLPKNEGNSQEVGSKKYDNRSSLSVSQLTQGQSPIALETIINLLPYYLFVVDVKSKTILLTNSGLNQSLALSESEIMGKTIAECFGQEYVSQIIWQNEQVISSKQGLQIQEKVELAGEIHYFDTVVTPLFDAHGEIYALLRTSSDIPDLAATQEELSQRTLQLEAANRELESFSYSVSHDLQAPLRVINGFSQVLWSNYQPHLDDRGKHYLQRIQANSQRMSDLIDALLQLSRITRTQMKVEQVNLSAIVMEITEELQAEDSARQVELTIAPDLQAKGDPQLLRIALSNLLHNAWKYTSNRTLAKIEFGSITQNDSSLTFFIKDNGAGFDPEYADKLFTPFQRLHSQAEFPGTGIGLATVQRTIYRHGGKVWAEGECDQGAKVYFTL
ncbi:MAG: ATP-binding protein [Cyanobacteria bacterium P01_G01_bin.39]